MPKNKRRVPGDLFSLKTGQAGFSSLSQCTHTFGQLAPQYILKIQQEYRHHFMVAPTETMTFKHISP